MQNGQGFAHMGLQQQGRPGGKAGEMPGFVKQEMPGGMAMGAGVSGPMHQMGVWGAGPHAGMPQGMEGQPGDWRGDTSGMPRFPKRGQHRRSASDSFALMGGRGRGGYMETSTSGSAAPSGEVEGDLSSLNDEQLFSMFMDVDSLNALGTLDGGARDPDSPSVSPAMTPSGNDGDPDDPNMLDPKRAKRILANRQSAQRSRMRKLQYISELERSVSKLHQEVAALTPQVAFLRSKHGSLNGQNTELRTRIASVVQESQYKDSVNERLRTELQRVKGGEGQGREPKKE